MALGTQKTQLYTYNSDKSKVVEIGCPTSISGAGAGETDQIETTCLNADARTYLAGLKTPGTVSFDINFDPQDDSHNQLIALQKSGDTVPWAIGFSDGTTTPSYTDPDWDFTSGSNVERSNIDFNGFVTKVEFDFSLNEVVSASVDVQITGDVTITPKDS